MAKREVQYGNKEVLASARKGNAPGVSATAAKGNIARANGGRVGGFASGGKVGSDKSPFSSAHYAFGGAVKKN